MAQQRIRGLKRAAGWVPPEHRAAARSIHEHARQWGHPDADSFCRAIGLPVGVDLVDNRAPEPPRRRRRPSPPPAPIQPDVEGDVELPDEEADRGEL